MAGKFIGPGERPQLIPEHELLQLHLIWSAKEAMYKAFGRRQLDFKEHLVVDLGKFTPESIGGSAFLKKGNIEMLFDLNFRIFDDFVLVGCVEKVPGI
jgi:4'-phosphopantetheinyl transferase EntD